MTEINLRNEYMAETNKPAFWTDGVHKPYPTEEYCKWLELKIIELCKK